MATDRAVLCASAPADRLPFDDPTPLRLAPADTGGNVRHAVADVWSALGRSLPPAFDDLLELATYVYCADQAVSRGGPTDLGRSWRRRFFFRVPVRLPDLWAGDRVLDALRSTLSFLTDDEYLFEFVPRGGGPTGRQARLDFRATPYEGLVDEVCLFSGGLDSLGGAVEEAVVRGRKVALVCHRSNAKPGAAAGRVGPAPPRAGRPGRPGLPAGRGEQGRGSDPGHDPAGPVVPVRGPRDDGGGAARPGPPPVLRERGGEPEPADLSPGGRRAGVPTTHPRALAGFARLFSELTGRPFAVENPFLWETKVGVVRRVAAAGCGDLIRHAVSCAHTWQMTNASPHCGHCSQCIDRRFAVLAAGQADNDPADGYRTDLFTGGRPEGESRAMLAGYLETASQVESMSAGQFLARFGEVARALRHLPGGADAAAGRVYELYRSHAHEVVGVVDREIAEVVKAGALRRRELPDGCLVRLVTDQSLPADDDPAPEDDSSTANVFCRHGENWEVRYAGGKCFSLPLWAGATYLHALLSKPNTPIAAVDLERLNMPEGAFRARGDGTERADGRAVKEYREEFARLQDKLDRARKENDKFEEADALKQMRELAKAMGAVEGFGGRVKRDDSDRDRARKSVRNAIDRTVRKIDKYDRALADHLSPPRLTCGHNPVYTPPGDISWRT